MNSRLSFFNRYWARINSKLEVGEALLDLGMGMPDPENFPIPEILKKELLASVYENDYRLYTPPQGPKKLLSEILDFENSQLGPSCKKYEHGNIILVPGAIQGFELLIKHLIRPGDRIATTIPNYFSLASASERLAKTLYVKADSLTELNLEEIEKVIQQGVRVFWLCQPNNPTGLYFNSSSFSQLICLCEKYSVSFIVDETCDSYRYNPHRLSEEIISNNVFRIKSFSKDLNFAGYRIGYILGPEQIISSISSYLPVVYGNPCVMPHRALLTEFLLRNGKLTDSAYSNCINQNQITMRESRDFFCERLWQLSNISQIIVPEASYYVFAKLDLPISGEIFCEKVLQSQNLDIVPGEVFGMPLESGCWARMCFARNNDFLSNAISKLEDFLNYIK
jgi:aspartate/methionine/tyrosine aminotransferase